VSIELVDSRLDERLEFEVARDKALDAFRHPYAYAPARVLNPFDREERAGADMTVEPLDIRGQLVRRLHGRLYRHPKEAKATNTIRRVWRFIVDRPLV
jgi:hypothetical protein